jgi:hypothetical protein
MNIFHEYKQQMLSESCRFVLQRTMAGGIEIKTKGEKKLTALFKKLGGKVVWVADKGAMLEFPTTGAADEFKMTAKASGAIFDSDSDVRELLADDGLTEGVEAYGFKGMSRQRWNKTFKNTEALMKWADDNDAEVIGTRDTEGSTGATKAAGYQGKHLRIQDDLKAWEAAEGNDRAGARNPR